jgi:hypothetical protein
MNEIILAPCDVISKIKQNSSDMNEIILASCDAGYVQSCTGFRIGSIPTVHNPIFSSHFTIYGCFLGFLKKKCRIP